MTEFEQRKFGWLKEVTKDPRDLIYSAPLGVDPEEKEVDMRAEFSEPYDQGQLGSCTANAIGGASEHYDIKHNYKWPHIPSRLFIYYNERVLIDTVNEDSGAYIKDGIKVLNKFGACPELIRDGSTPEWLWPYSDDSETFKKKPKDICYEKAVLHKALKYESVPLNRSSVLHCLAERKPIIFGFLVHQSFQSKTLAKTGVMPVPKFQLIDPVLGGHAVCAVGYLLDHPMEGSKETEWIIVRNSWGTSWGDKGYFYFPLKAFLNKSEVSDLWAITEVGYSKAE